MQVQKLASKTLIGLKVRTCNASEMNSGTAKIADLWQEFYAKHSSQLTDETKVYGVYTNYETDLSGDFDVIACTDGIKEGSKGTTSVTTQQGRYLVFSGEGEMPDAVIDLWGEIWQYFSSDDCCYKRTYTSDYEYYKNENVVEIAIAIE